MAIKICRDCPCYKISRLYLIPKASRYADMMMQQHQDEDLSVLARNGLWDKYFHARLDKMAKESGIAPGLR